jgi:putative endonuclease
MYKKYFTYIMSCPSNTTLYIGVTGNLERRVAKHRTGAKHTAFCTRYNCRKSVYYEEFSNIEEAIERETQIKKWKRARKDKLIDAVNPERVDLMPEGEILTSLRSSE